ncbi:MAG: fibronectin type III domain-containing protein, partial [Saprospiraceae bacterium]|nr:fibronectin type III domain-containing protein [Saprospiraceae bacterium]
MKFSVLRALFFALSLLAVEALQAQCQYTLQMFDSYGDGWNGCKLTITSGAVMTTYTLDNINDDGIDSTLTFPVTDGAPLVFTYTTASFPWEVSFKIFDNTGALFFESNAPAAGTLYNGIGDCIECGQPSNFAVDNIWDNRVRLRWQPNTGGTNAPVSWRVVYGPQGFSLNGGEGDTLVSALNKVTIQGLQKKTWYDAYVQQYCDVAGGYSTFSGPVSFQTYWTNDIGITGVVAPLSGCDLGMDSVKVVVKNFGSAPQSLFTYRYAVNGQAAPVVPPSDGFYTGILGKDSSVVIAFETLSNFSVSGEYRLDVFTELGTDEDLQNDTFTYYFTNRLQPTYVQLFETWGGGWEPGGENSSWEYGKPNKPAIPNAASGESAWVTSLTGSYNANEASFLTSPCFDFSEVDTDPVIAFSINLAMQQDFDGVWLETSVDGGQNWEKVGEVGEGENWYNGEIDFLGLSDAWSGNSNGWMNARHSLPGTAGESEVHLRFVLRTSPFFSGGGCGIDDIRIFEAFPKDLAGLSLFTLGDEEECGLENDQVVFTFLNAGSAAQGSLKVAYSINGGAPVQQNVNGTIGVDQQLTHTFSVPFDSRDGSFVIQCWTNLGGDQDHANDTITYVVNHTPDPLPYQENFEALDAPPADWAYDPTFGFSVTSEHNNISKVLAFNLYSGNTEFTADMPRMGLVQSGDSLRFTYRITNFASQGQTATVLQGGSKIEIQASTDCGGTWETFFTINNLNHLPTVQLRERKISLENYVGKNIKIRYHGIWGA